MARVHPSPNHGARRDGLVPHLIVLHYTGMRGAADALARLCCPEAQVSAHYLIDLDGTAVQMVREAARAWHAGAGEWAGQADINSRSIGVELVNTGAHPFPAPQMRALAALMRHLMARWHIAPADVIAHSDMAPERKDDPGPRFDWRALAAQGLALYPDGMGADRPLAASLDAIGYPDCDPEKRLQAFRFRFAPWLTGPETQADRRRADCVAQGFAPGFAQGG